MTTTEQQTAAQQTATGIANGLRQLADMIEANPDIKVPYFKEVSVWCPSGTEELRAIIRAAKAAGGKVEKQYSDVMANVRIAFGPVGAMALAYRSEVCERVVVGQETVQVPDPAFVPPDTPMVEQVVDKVEWRCRPIMDEATS